MRSIMNLVPMIVFLLILTLVLNHMLRGLVYQPLLILLAIAFGWVIAVNKEEKQ